MILARALLATLKQITDINTFCYGARAPCTMHTEVNTMTLAFEKRQSFLARLTGKDIGGKTQICLSDQQFGVEFKGLGKDKVGW